MIGDIVSKLSLQNDCAARLQTLLPWMRHYLRGLLRQAPEGTLGLHDIRVLARLIRFPGISLQVLADDLGISKATASGRVEQLVAQGLCERSVNPRSRREVMLSITPAGVREHRKAKDYLKANLVAQMDAFTHDELMNLEKGLVLLTRIVSQAHPEIGSHLNEQIAELKVP